MRLATEMRTVRTAATCCKVTDLPLVLIMINVPMDCAVETELECRLCGSLFGAEELEDDTCRECLIDFNGALSPLPAPLIIAAAVRYSALTTVY